MKSENYPEKLNIFRRFWVLLLSFFRAHFWRNHLNLVFFFSALFFNILSWVFLIYFIKPSAYPLPLHYNIYFGVDLIGAYSRIFTLPLVGFLIILMNFILAFWFYLKDRLVSYILLLTSSVVQIFILIGVVSLIYINQ